MYKVIFNNLIIDIMEKPRYTRFLPKSQRVVGTDRLAATGIMSSNGEEIYHLEGKLNDYPEQLKTVELIKIDKKEFEKLTTELIYLREKEQEQQEEPLVQINQLQEQVNALANLMNQLIQNSNNSKVINQIKS